MKNTSIFGWIARILSILAIAFISLFALDAFDHGSFGEKMLAFAMHMLPSVVLAFALWIAWRHEFAGGVLFVLLGAGTAYYVYQMNLARTGEVWTALGVVAMINLPFVLVGILFLWSYLRRKTQIKVKM